MTPIFPFRVAETAAAAPGAMTPTIGSSNSPRSSSSAQALAVLQATTMALTDRLRRKLTIWREKRTIVSFDLLP